MSKGKIKFRNNGDTEIKLRLNYQQSLALATMSKYFKVEPIDIVKKSLLVMLEAGIREMNNKEGGTTDENKFEGNAGE